MKIAIFLITLIFISQISAQQIYPFGFKNSNLIGVKDSLNRSLTMPMVGGLNSVHFQQMDLDLDGVLDLISFDSHGDRLKTYINKNISDSVAYEYAPQYELALPQFMCWIQTYDYDGDGKKDIFSYVPAGIRVYRNTSTATLLKFDEVTYMLKYHSTAGFDENIFVTSVDFPALQDVDYDGDMDILTFHILGSRVIWYRNYSIENGNFLPGLDFKIDTECYGDFAENDTSNALVLNINCSKKMDAKTGEKHTGSTLLSLNLNGDTLMDLILGDVDFFGMAALINGGTQEEAEMISQDSQFPAYDSSIQIVTFPVATYFDIDNDSVGELIVSPFDPSWYKVDSKNSIWMYENTGTHDSPIFSYKQNNFFQENMIDVGDGALPTLIDVNGDGLQDLIIGNYGNVDSTYYDLALDLYTIKYSQLSYYQNVGLASSPIFKLITEDWQGLSKLKKLSLYPSFGDVDGDLDVDMILGSNDGKLMFFENKSDTSVEMIFDTIVFNYKNILVSMYSAPQLIDIDGDSLLDLVIGQRSGYISYYQNTGSAINPMFSLVTHEMGNVRTIDYFNTPYGYSIPYFFYDTDDTLKAFVGSASGLLFYYEDIRDHVQDTFAIDSNWLHVNYAETLYSVLNYTNLGNVMQSYNVGMRSAPVIYDFNNDGFMDVLIGTFSGGLEFLEGITAPGVGISTGVKPQNNFVKAYPNPTEKQFSLDFAISPISYQLTLLDISGRKVKVYPQTSNLNQHFEVSDLSPGIYFGIVNMTTHEEYKTSSFKLLVK